MRRTVRMAREAGVAVGAHPGLPDLVGFGRREMRVTPQEVEDMVPIRSGALRAIASAEGVRCGTSRRTARSTTWPRGIEGWPRRLPAPSGRWTPVDPVRTCRIRNVARRRAPPGSPTAAEGFADRTYEPDGSLTPRAQAHALLQDQGSVVSTRGADGQPGLGGHDRRVGDRDARGHHLHPRRHPGAPELARAVRAGLERAGIAIAAVGGAKP